MSPASPIRNFFHLGYVVRSLPAVTASMRERFGVERWKILPLPEDLPATGMGFAYVRDTLIELVEVNPRGQLLPIHRDFVPPSDSEARLNHLAYLLPSEDELRATIASFEGRGVATAFVAEFGDIFSRYYYADTTTQLGHYSEFVCLGPAGQDFLADIPRN